MPDLPQRPRAHVLEDESRRAWHTALPPEWVRRRVEPDYGIDETVEIFEEGAATGLIFNVQLRATDDADLNSALKLRIRDRQLAYFASLELPVLLVRYLASTRQLFALWFHRLDPHPGQSPRVVRFDASHEVTGNAASLLASEVRLVRDLRSGQFQWPATFLVATDSHGARGFTAAECAAEISAAAGAWSRLVAFRAAEPSSGTPTAPSVLLTEDRIVVHLGIASVTLHLPGGSEMPAGFRDDVLLASALVLANTSQAARIAELAAWAAPRSNFAFDHDVIARLAGLFARTNFSHAVSVADAYRKQADRPAGQLLTFLTMVPRADQLDADDGRLFRDFLSACITDARGAGELAEAARYAYSLGNWLFHSAHDYPGALEAHQSALRMDPSYAERNYFCAELAAALFETDDYEGAINWYSKALDLRDDPETVACLADAHMHAGNVGDARSHFNEYLGTADQPDPIWYLRAWSFTRLVSPEAGLCERRIAEAGGLVDNALQIDDDQARVRLIERAIALDPVSFRARHLEAQQLVNSAQDFVRALPPLLFAATGNWEPEAWVEALFVTIRAAQADLIEIVIMGALQRCGGMFKSTVAQQIRDAPSELRSNVLTEIERIEEATTELRRDETMLRIHADTGIEELRFSG